MIDLIFDCDITMGLPGRDVDDGLALLYLAGESEINLLGVTSTFGNSSIEKVHPCLLRTLKDMGLTHIPAYRGASHPPNPGHYDADTGDIRGHSDAARFMAERIHRDPGTVCILATGSTTNLLGAYQLNPEFFSEVKEIVLMGGIYEPLIINGREMKELNLASDPAAAFYTLYAGQPPTATAGGTAGAGSPSTPEGCPVTVISGNLCLQALLTQDRFDHLLQKLDSTAGPEAGLASYLREKILPWFAWTEALYGLPGFHAWDATAALYLSHRDLFESQALRLRSSLKDLKTGLLRTEQVSEAPDNGFSLSRQINLPSRIRDTEKYWRVLFDSWCRAGAAWSLK